METFVAIEHLTGWGCLTVVLPRLIRQRGAHVASRRVFVIDATAPGWCCARIALRCIGYRVERFTFRLVELHDEEGLLLRLRIAYQDLMEVQDDAVATPEFQDFIRAWEGSGRLPQFLAKTITTINIEDRGTLWRALLVIHAVRLRARVLCPGAERVLLFMERRPWSAVIERYGARHGVEITWVAPAWSIPAFLRRHFPVRLLEALRMLRNTWATMRLRAPPRRQTPPRSGGTPLLTVDHSGHCSLGHPERYSDLFFVDASSINPADVLLLFGFKDDALDDEKWRLLCASGMGACARYPGASTVPEVPIFAHYPAWRSSRHLRRGASARAPRDVRWLTRAADTYEVLVAYWEALFRRTGARIHVRWHRFDAHHFAIADALDRVGGVSVVYQRAYQSDSSAELHVEADIMFGFAPADAEIERQSKSNIRYHVAVGYIGDHRAALLKPRATVLRAKLQRAGAAYTVAYFDENSGPDPRWHTGHAFQRDHYLFLLRHLLADPALGLVLKPKAPATLRARMGPECAALLDAAIVTGRCALFTSGALQGVHPPVEAALAADVAIHGHLCAANAGLEAALAGVPTLLLDGEGWARSALYGLGEGRVVFRDWETLWERLTAYRKHPDRLPGFGDWSAMLSQFDPFRDGRAAARMGAYLHGILDGLKRGGDRDTVLADAAARYTSQWGADKITVVRQHTL